MKDYKKNHSIATNLQQISFTGSIKPMVDIKRKCLRGKNIDADLA